MHHEDWAFLIYASYVPILISILLLEVFVIIRNRKQYNSSFYRIFSVLGVVDVMACLIGSFLYRIPLYKMIAGFYSGLLGKREWLPAVHTMGYYLNCLSQFLGVLLAFNRFSGVFLPQYHDQIWRRGLIVGILISLLISAVPVWFLIDCSIEFYSSEIFEVTDDSIYFLMIDPKPQQQIWLNMTVVTVVCNAISTVIYVACLVRLCFFSNTRNFTIERNFFLVGFSSMIFSLPYMAAMLPWLTDLKYLSPAPILLLTNKSIRISIRTIFCRNQVKKVNTFTKVTTAPHSSNAA